jgi:hypothetical protein
MAFAYNHILNIPERCLLYKKLTKAFFLKNFDLSVAEKKCLNTTIQSMEWLASIKPATANIAAIKNADIAYEEIQVIICTLPLNSLEAMADKCSTLIQKYIPYPILLILEDEENFIINNASKRINQVDVTKRTIEVTMSTSIISKLYKTAPSAAFFDALNFAELDKTNLQTTYQSYVQAIVQYQASNITGVFLKRLKSRTATDMLLLQQIDIAEKELLALSNMLKKQTQLNNKVSLNIDMQHKKKQIEQLKKELSTE